MSAPWRWILLRPMAEEFTKMGIATWNLEYRRLVNAGGGWPGTFEDVGRGTDHLRKLHGSIGAILGWHSVSDQPAALTGIDPNVRFDHKDVVTEI
jgi:hypothetical protein